MKRYFLKIVFLVGFLGIYSLSRSGSFDISTNTQPKKKSTDSGSDYSLSTDDTPKTKPTDSGSDYSLPTDDTPKTKPTDSGSDYSLPIDDTPKTAPATPVASFTFEPPVNVVALNKNLVDIQKPLIDMALQVESLFQWYGQQKDTVRASFSLPGAQDVVAPAKVKDIVDTEQFAKIQSYMVGASNSYLSTIQQLWKAYADQISTLTPGQVTGFNKVPLQKDSPLIGVYTQLVGQILQFLKIRMALISSENYGEKGANAFLTVELPALEAIITQVDTLFSNYAKSKNLSTDTDLQGYMAISNSYFSQRSFMILNWTLSIFKDLAAEYPQSSSLNGSIVENPFKFEALENYFALAQKAQDALNQLAKDQQTKPPAVGVYVSPTDAFYKINEWIGSFYTYAACAVQNKITSLCNSPEALQYQSKITFNQSNASVSSSSFSNKVVSLIKDIKNYYGNASSSLKVQGDNLTSTAYAQISFYFGIAQINWANGDSYIGNGDFPNAINAYQAAAAAIKQTNNLPLSFVLERRSDIAAFMYYFYIFQTYSETYQSIMPKAIQQMTTVPSHVVSSQEVTAWHSGYPNGFMQLFYYEPGANPPASAPAFQGIAWICEQALPLLKNMLLAYETDTTDQGIMVESYLRQSIAVANALSEGARIMFYNDPKVESETIGGSSPIIPAQEMSADANICSCTTQGIVEGYLQYIKAYGAFSKADQLLQEKTITLQLPFQGVFADVSKGYGFANFNSSYQAYWSLMNIDTCLSLITSYPTYAQELISSALVLLTYAKMLGADAAYLDKKSQSILAATYGPTNQAPLMLLSNEGKEYRDEATSSLDFETALTCFGAAALLNTGNVGAQKDYYQTVDAYASWYGTQKDLPFASLYTAMVYYRGYLAQQKGWQGSAVTDYKSLMITAMNSFLQSVTAFEKSLTQSIAASNYEDTTKAVQQLGTLYDEMQFMVIRQQRDQQFLGLTGNDFLTVVTKTVPESSALDAQMPGQRLIESNKTVPVVLYGYKGAADSAFAQLVDPQYMLGQLYYAQAQSVFSQVKDKFDHQIYDSSIQNDYKTLTNYFIESVDAFSKGGHDAMSIQVQQALTKAAAYSYYSLVIPSKAVSDLLDNTMPSSAPLSQSAQKITPQPGSSGSSGSFSLPTEKTGTGTTPSSSASFSLPSTVQKTSNSSAPVPTGPTIDAVLQPDYLIRYVEQNLTVLADQEGTTPNNQSVKSDSSYKTLLATASSLLQSKGGKSITTSASDTSLVTSLVGPLYKLSLIKNGYTSDFNTLDEEADRYNKQVLGLVTKGMLINGKILYSSYTLEKRVIDGKDTIILITQNGPLLAIPRFKGDLQTALFYYMLYTQFYSNNPSQVQIGGSVYSQIEDSDGKVRAKTFKLIIGAYFIQATSYANQINDIMKKAPAAQSDPISFKFSDYAATYNLMGQGYTWLIANYNSIIDVQQNEGIIWVSSEAINTTLFGIYNQYIQHTGMFLVGDPLNESYKGILDSIATLSYTAGLLTKNSQQISQIQTVVGDYYVKAGDQTSLQAARPVTFNNYPSFAPSKLPYETLSFTEQHQDLETTTNCTLPLPDSLESPKQPFTPLQWKSYFKAAAYYSQALQYYKKGYQMVHSDDYLIKDNKSRLAWGKYLMNLIQEVTQQTSLFGRNAFDATITKDSKVGTTISIDESADFKEIVVQGQSNGDIALLENFNKLQGGGATISNGQDAQNKYTIMKNLLLNALIYSTSLLTLSNDMAQRFPGDNTLAGKTIKWGVGYYTPWLMSNIASTAKATNGKPVTDREELVVAMPASLISLGGLEQQAQEQLVYATTFPAFMQYCIRVLMGDSKDSFSKLSTGENAIGFHSFVSQLHIFLRSLYIKAFLPGVTDPLAQEDAIKVAMNAATQNMLVNPEAYVG